ncbi:MAG: hypothetical protein QNJ22_05875 [Desulfosarcinaceae bacterium]|nr:hypothetical protein [Desulfosarcinaceae bacterium]
MFRSGSREWAVIAGAGWLLFLALLGCGSGGDGGLGYEGNREPATVTAENAQVLAVAAYDSAALEGPFTSFASLNGGTLPAIGSPSGRPVLLSVADLLTAAVQQTQMAEPDAAAPVRALTVGSYTITGNCGGEADVDIQIDDETGLFSGSLAFREYCDEGTALQGVASYQGEVDPETDELVSFAFSFKNLSGSADGDRFRLTGELTIQVGAAPGEATLTMDLLFTDAGSGEALWLNNLTLGVAEGVADGAAFETITFSGRVYHPVHGYVEIQTDVPFRIAADDDYPGEGGLRLAGAADATIWLTVISNAQYQVEADLDGDETVDWGPENYDWDS